MVGVRTKTIPITAVSKSSFNCAARKTVNFQLCQDREEEQPKEKKRHTKELQWCTIDSRKTALSEF